MKAFEEERAKAVAKGIDVGMGAGPSLVSADASLPSEAAPVPMDKKKTWKNGSQEIFTSSESFENHRCFEATCRSAMDVLSVVT